MRHGCDDRDMRWAWKMANKFGGPGGPFGASGPFGPDGPFGADGPFGPGGPFGGRGGRHGRRRMFDRGELRLVLLKLIADQSRHGYDLIKAIEDMTGGEYAPSPGVIYPTLQLMVDEGVIAELPDESSRKVFAATDAGREELAKEEALVSELLERLSSLGEERRSSPHRQIHRAMENLRNSLRFQRQAGELVDEMVEQITDIIDEAARRIERL
jgi:DNA-binding PadR family transcriptional regulator